MNEKLYVLVRSDLSKSQQAVQAGHAVAEWLLKHRSCQCHCSTWANGVLVYLKVRNEAELLEWSSRINSKTGCTSSFTEPDLNESLTAVAAFGISDLVNTLPLL